MRRKSSPKKVKNRESQVQRKSNQRKLLTRSLGLEKLPINNKNFPTSFLQISCCKIQTNLHQESRVLRKSSPEKVQSRASRVQRKSSPEKFKSEKVKSRESQVLRKSSPEKVKSRKSQVQRKSSPEKFKSRESQVQRKSSPEKEMNQ